MCLCFADILPMFLISRKYINMANRLLSNFYNFYNENMRRKTFLKAPSIDHHVCMYVGVHVRMYVMYVCMHVCVYVCMYVCVYVCMYVCVCVCVCVCVYVRIYACM